jgi:hypothetical protein
VRRSRRPDADGFVGQFDVLGFAVGLGIDDDRLDAHLAAGALDPERYLAAVGNEYFFEHVRLESDDQASHRGTGFAGPLADGTVLGGAQAAAPSGRPSKQRLWRCVAR